MKGSENERNKHNYRIFMQIIHIEVEIDFLIAIKERMK